MTFTLHDFTDFYVERVTAHRIKINGHSCFHNFWRATVIRSLRILRVGRIGSAVHTIVNLYIVIPYLLVLFNSSFIICVFVLSLSFCCTAVATVTKTNTWQ